jgi:hypothetical protein
VGNRGLPVGWDVEAASPTSIQFGADWLLAETSALLFLPSMIVVEEFNVLINPAHPDAAGHHQQQGSQVALRPTPAPDRMKVEFADVLEAGRGCHSIRERTRRASAHIELSIRADLGKARPLQGASNAKDADFVRRIIYGSGRQHRPGR